MQPKAAKNVAKSAKTWLKIGTTVATKYSADCWLDNHQRRTLPFTAKLIFIVKALPIVISDTVDRIKVDKVV